MRRALSGDGIAARSSSRRGYHRTTSAPSNTNLSIANHNHHLHHHHNEMLQQHRKGQDPMDTFDHVRDWTLHQYTELQIVRPKDNRYDHEEYVLKCIRLGAKQTNTDNGDDIRQKDKTQVDPHQLRTIRNAIASIQVMDHPHILGVSVCVLVCSCARVLYYILLDIQKMSCQQVLGSVRYRVFLWHCIQSRQSLDE